MDLEYAMDLGYSVVARPDRTTDGRFCYVAEHPDLDGCVGYGETLEEAKSSLARAKKAYLAHCIATHQDIPMPSSSHVVEWRSGTMDTISAVAPKWHCTPEDGAVIWDGLMTTP